MKKFLSLLLIALPLFAAGQNWILTQNIQEPNPSLPRYRYGIMADTMVVIPYYPIRNNYLNGRQDGKIQLNSLDKELYLKVSGSWKHFTSQQYSDSVYANKQALIDSINAIRSYGYIVSEIDGSVINEIELPAQSGHSGKVLSTDGTSPQWMNLTFGTVSSVGVSSSNLTVSGSPVISTGTININLPTTVTAGTYGRVTVDQFGRVTAGKRQETYSGTTSGSGTYSVTFGTPYSTSPNIQANIIGGTAKQFIVVTVTTTGFTITAYQLNSVNLLGIDVLLSTTATLNGANIDVLITEK